jgi:hypothetical protein
MLTDIRRVTRGFGTNSLTASQYAERGQFGVNTITRRFGSWNAALQAAELSLNNRLNIPEEELFENLAEVWRKLGRQPFGREFDKVHGFSSFSLGTYEKRFGSWNRALECFVEFLRDGKSGGRSEDAFPEQKTSGKRTARKINWRLRATVLIRDNCICQMCGASPAKDRLVQLHVDHIEPYSKGGETVPENLQTLCAVCNIGKSNEL